MFLIAGMMFRRKSNPGLDLNHDLDRPVPRRRERSQRTRMRAELRGLMG